MGARAAAGAGVSARERVGKTMKKYALIFIFLPFIASCTSDVSVPEGKSIDGCYADDSGLTILLRAGHFKAGPIISGKYSFGRDQSGTYLIFTPGFHKNVKNNITVVVKDSDLTSAMVTVVMETGSIRLLIPSDPLGLDKFSEIKCQN